MRQVSVAVILFLIFCPLNSRAQTRLFNKILPDTSKTQQPNWFYNYVTNLSKELDLNRIDNGIDSFCLRVWIYGISAPSEVISLRYNQDNWYSSRTFYWISFPKIGEKGYGGGVNMDAFSLMVVDSSQTNRVLPRISYSRIVDSIQSFKILDIPSQNEILTFNGKSLDGYNYTIEIATSGYYKIIDYHNPGFYVKTDAMNRKVTQLLVFLSTYLTPFHISGH